MLSLTDRDRDNPIKYANASVYCGPITSFVSACVSVYVPVNVSDARYEIVLFAYSCFAVRPFKGRPS